MHLNELIAQCEAWHDKYCSILAAWVPEKLTKRPKLRLVINSAKWAGRYGPLQHTCWIDLAYGFLPENHIEETIAHEACHAYQRYLGIKTKWHGEMFYFMLRNVCGFKTATAKHHMNVKAVKVIAQVLLSSPHNKKFVYTKKIRIDK